MATPAKTELDAASELIEVTEDSYPEQFQDDQDNQDQEPMARICHLFDCYLNDDPEPCPDSPKPDIPKLDIPTVTVDNDDMVPESSGPVPNTLEPVPHASQLPDGDKPGESQPEENLPDKNHQPEENHPPVAPRRKGPKPRINEEGLSVSEKEQLEKKRAASRKWHQKWESKGVPKKAKTEEPQSAQDPPGQPAQDPPGSTGQPAEGSLEPLRAIDFTSLDEARTAFVKHWIANSDLAPSMERRNIALKFWMASPLRAENDGHPQRSPKINWNLDVIPVCSISLICSLFEWISFETNLCV